MLNRLIIKQERIKNLLRISHKEETAIKEAKKEERESV